MKFNIDFGKVNFDDINVYKSLLENNSLKNSSSQNIEEIDYSNYDNVNDINFDMEQGKINAIEMDNERRIREAEEARIKAEQERKAKEEELEKLYKARDDNNGLFHPNKEAEIEADILKLEKELGVPHQPDGFEKACDVVKSTGATVVVGATSVVSGIIDLGESAVDGCIWLGGTVVAGGARLVGADDFAEKVEQGTMDAIAYDFTSEVNKAFYEGTAMGRAIDDASYMKYDSKVAQGIQNVTTEVVIIAGATAATVVTGGAAAPLFVAGFAVGAGQSAERNFQDTENRDFWKDSAEIAIDGTIKGLSTAAYGKAGAMAYNGVKAISGLGLTGIKEVGKTTIKSFSKEAVKTTLKNSSKTVAKSAAINTLKDSDTWTETAAVLLNDVKTGVQTGEWNVGGMFLETVGVLGSNYIGNFGFGLATDMAKYSKNMSRVNNIPGMNSTQQSNVSDIFERERLVASEDYVDNFRTYREHARLHTESVTDYAVMLGLDLDNIDDKALAEIYYGSYFHDLGMAGGADNPNGLICGLNYNKKTGEYLGLINDVDNNGTDKTWSFLAGQATRDNHPLNSALSVLVDDIVPDGLDKSKIALLALSHSKSTSGISSFADRGQWETAISKLDDAVKNFNQLNGLTGADKIVFDADAMRKIISNSDSAEFKQLVDQALCIRDGDAMSDLALTKDGHTIMQTSNVAHVKAPKLSLDQDIPSLDDELKDVVDVVKDKDNKELFNVDDKFGKLFHAGEENVRFDSSYDGTKYVGRASLVDPQKVPNSSIFVMSERLGELATYTNCDRKFIIDLPTELIDTPYGKSYVDAIETSISKELDDAYVKLLDKRISQEQFDSIKSFYINDIEITGFDDFKIEWSESVNG